MSQMSIADIRMYLAGEHYGVVASAFEHGQIPEEFYEYIFQYEEVVRFIGEWRTLGSGLNQKWDTGKVSWRAGLKALITEGKSMRHYYICEVNFSGMKIEGVDFRNCWFDYPDLRNVEFSKCKFQGSVFIQPRTNGQILISECAIDSEVEKQLAQMGATITGEFNGF